MKNKNKKISDTKNDFSSKNEERFFSNKEMKKDSDVIIKDHLIPNLENELLRIENELIEKKEMIRSAEKKHSDRNQKIINNERKFVLEKLILDILPTIDSLERAYSLLKASCKKKELTVKYMLKKVIKSFFLFLKKHQVDVVDTINLKFNPNVHQAISVQPSKRFKNNHILSIVQKGYLLNDRLLRPAMVIVVKN